MGRNNSFYLFAEPSFFSGMARALDLGATLQSYNEHNTKEDADKSAMTRDWRAVGDDICSSASISVKEYGQEQKEETACAAVAT